MKYTINPAPSPQGIKPCWKDYISIHPRSKTTEYSGRCWIKENEGIQESPKPDQNDQSTEKKKTFLDQKIDTLKNVYFRWIFPHWIFIVPFLLCFFILIYKRQFEILSFYSASFIFFILATFLNPLGYRSAIIVWPITYILFAFASWHFIEIVYDKTKGWKRNAFLGIIFLLLFLFFLLNAVFAFVFNENINVRNNYSIESGPAVTEYLLNEIPAKQTITLPLELITAGLGTMPSIKNRLVLYTAKPDYIVMTDLTKTPREKERSLFYKTIKKMAEKFGFFMQSEKIVSTRYIQPEGYALEKEFGIFDVYKKIR